eukprot:TRINITY_DN8635_c0_g1_i1.p1 TRINITY_DN8635_c0_g1~~TRINITY_DN8635_c0_g1_i1.p1  ORF type:complete len:424 (+),score=162.43 TRINITY_DN8635_c0_g1_i1:143-1414(+)
MAIKAMKGAMKSKAGAKKAVKKATSTKKVTVPPGLGKIRIGVVHGKNFDPVRVGTHDRDYPKKLQIMNNTGANADGWGGKYHIDVNTGLRIQRLYPEFFQVDLMKKEEISKERFAKNHVNFNLWGDVSLALNDDKKPLAKRIKDVQSKAEENHHYPSWNYYEWILHKSRYMKQCMKAGIPMIPTIFVENGFDAKKVLKQVKEKGWEKFLCKPGYMSFFGQGAIHGKTKDFEENFQLLLDYEKENKHQKEFLVQPFVLKPNGNVFDEIRNFFIDGEWSYSVYTDGTDYEGFYEQPAGKLKDACRKLATRAYKEVQKVSKWEGKPIDTLMTRIDVGIVPDKSKSLGYKIFINEIEPQMTTWLGRYCPFDLTPRMAEACVAQTRKILKLSLMKGRKFKDADKLKQLLALLDEKLGPVKMSMRPQKA